MNIPQLIARLEALRAVVGDTTEVMLLHPESGQPMPIEFVLVDTFPLEDSRVPGLCGPTVRVSLDPGIW